ncbi:MAG TPA: protein kinase, partial [Polyangiaceae bacterium]
MLAPGTLLTPNLRLLRVLGTGGMGSVWLASHLTLHTEVVVKLMRPELAREPETLARFSREAASAANVKSPHVVQIFDHGVTPDGAPYIVMEHLEGEDLHEYLERLGALAPAQVGEIVTQVAKALTRAHERGIVHRDIKPHNLFLCRVGDGETYVKVLDFGIAKATAELKGGLDTTSTGAIMGTPYYMSPEQALGQKSLDHRTDLWAVGVVAYELLTGRKAFDGESVGALAVAICSGNLPVPSSVNRALGASVDAWFAKACARRPDDRFASAKEQAEAFHAAISGAPVSRIPALALAATVPSIPPPVLAAGLHTTAPRRAAPSCSTEAPCSRPCSASRASRTPVTTSSWPGTPPEPKRASRPIWSSA